MVNYSFVISTYSIYFINEISNQFLQGHAVNLGQINVFICEFIYLIYVCKLDYSLLVFSLLLNKTIVMGEVWKNQIAVWKETGVFAGKLAGGRIIISARC